MASKNIRTSEYASFSDPVVQGLKTLPTAYAMPGTSGVVVSDISNGTKVSTTLNVVPTLTTSTAVPATTTSTGEVGNTSAGKWIRLTHTTDVTYNLQGGFAKNAILMGVQAGSGKITFACPTGSINPVVGYLNKTRGIGAVFAIIHIGNNVWDLMGDLEAV